MEDIETPGLGFDIITNSAASAIAYTALNKHEVTKQYLKQSNAASRQLIANLPFLTSDSMSQSDIFEYKHQIDQSLLLAQKLVDSNNFLTLYKIPNRGFQPFVIENAHIQSLVPVVRGDEANAGTVFYAFVGNKRNAHTVVHQIQCGTGSIHGANDSFI